MKNLGSMGRAERVLFLVNVIKNGNGKFNSGTISRNYEIPKAAAERDLKLAKQHGFLRYDENKKCYFYTGGTTFNIQGRYFHESEITKVISLIEKELMRIEGILSSDASTSSAAILYGNDKKTLEDIKKKFQRLNKGSSLR